jgi:hypothetical protein
MSWTAAAKATLNASSLASLNTQYRGLANPDPSTDSTSLLRAMFSHLPISLINNKPLGPCQRPLDLEPNTRFIAPFFLPQQDAGWQTPLLQGWAEV